MGQIKTKERVEKYGEVFTAEREVNAMLDLVKQETERVDSRFLEPACGDGNFLVEILRRKLVLLMYSPDDYKVLSLYALNSIYGIDILPDNVEAARRRLFELWKDKYEQVCGHAPDDSAMGAARLILKDNVVCGNFLTRTLSTGDPIDFLTEEE